MSGYAERHRQLSDRQAYTSALETQLQRATHALAAAQAFTEKVDVLQTQLNSVEDKVVNITRLAKLQQSVSEGQEQELQRLNAEVSAVHLAKSAHDSGLLSRKVEALELRIRGLEEKTVEETPSLSKARVFKEIDHSLRETEDRIAVRATQAVLERTNLDIEHKHKILQEQVTRTMETCFQDCRALDRRLAELEIRQTGAPQRSSLESFPRGDSNLALELREVKESAWNCELTCNRLAEDSLNRISACEQLLRDLEITVRETMRTRDARVAKEELEALDRKLSDKLSEAVDRMGKVVRMSSDAAKTLITEVTGLERRTKSLERSIEIKKTSPIRPSRSTTSSPKTLEKVAEDKPKEQAKSAPRAKTPPKKEPTKSPTKEPAKNPTKESRKKSTTPKKALTPRSTKKKSSSPPPLSPSTLKSKARDASIKEKFKKTEKKKTDRRSRLEQLYQKLSAKTIQ